MDTAVALRLNIREAVMKLVLRAILAGRDAFSLGFVNAEERVRVRPQGSLPPPYQPKREPHRFRND